LAVRQARNAVAIAVLLRAVAVAVNATPKNKNIQKAE